MPNLFTKHRFSLATPIRAALLALSACALPALPALAAIPEAERLALIDLYNSTNGDGWTDKSGWKTAGNFSPVPSATGSASNAMAPRTT